MKRYGWIFLGILALVLLLGGVWLGYAGVGSYGAWGMMGGYPGMMGGYGYPIIGWVGGLGMLLFWGLVIAGIVWLVRSTTQGREHSIDKGPASESPLDIIKRRYASGDITKEQFDEMKRGLGL
jgi:putative membrane protein